MTERERLIELLEKAKEKAMYTVGSLNNGFGAWFADYLLANGVIVPLCKVGDYVWVVYTPKWPANPADQGKWFMRRDGVQRIICGAKGLSIETWNMGTIPEKEIGKKLFLTEEEAKKALAERSRG